MKSCEAIDATMAINFAEEQRIQSKKINDLRAYLAELSIAKSPYGKNDEKTEQACSHKKQTTRKVVEK